MLKPPFVRTMRVAITLLCGAVMGLSALASHGAPELGLYRWDAPTGMANIEAFGAWLGRPVTVATAFEARSTWDEINGASWQLGAWGQWASAQPGRNLSLAVPMLPMSGASLASCAAGLYDVHWETLAHELTLNLLPAAYLRLGWEMDGGWFAWNAPPGSGKEASFAGCFRRIVQVMRFAQPSNQWKFVLDTAAGWYSKAYLDAVWPGDAYVDVVAIDLYDQSWAADTYPYPSPCDATCRLTRQQKAWNSYSWHLYTIRDFALAHGKKVALPEWGVAIRPDGHGGGDNPYYIEKMHEFIHDPANQVAFHGYWGISAADIDSRLTDPVQGDYPSGATRFPQSAARFKELFGAPAANAAPTVSFTAPAADQTVSGTVPYAANATDDAGVARVDFFVDGTLLVSDGAAPYGGSLDTTKLANGTRTLRAVAFDAAGASTATTRSINVQNVTAPTGVAFLAPADRATLSGAFSDSVACELTGTGISQVVFFLDGTQLNTETWAPWNCSIDTRRFRNGWHTLKAVAYGSGGASSTVTRTVRIRN